MTSPATPSGSEDIPLAQVKNVGVTEITTGLVILGSILTMLFGTDWGIRAHAVDQAPNVLEVATAALALARALKHVGVAHANAKVISAHAARPAAAGDVAADLPVVPIDAGHTNGDLLALIFAITLGVVLGGVLLHALY